MSTNITVIYVSMPNGNNTVHEHALSNISFSCYRKLNGLKIEKKLFIGYLYIVEEDCAKYI